VIADSANAVKINWDLVPNASGYVIQYSTDEGFNTFITLPGISASKTDATITGLDADTTYYFRIMTLGTGTYSNSAYSTALSVKTLTPSASPIASFWYDWNGIEEELFLPV
jgi:hypothetical protein